MKGRRKRGAQRPRTRFGLRHRSSRVQLGLLQGIIRTDATPLTSRRPCRVVRCLHTLPARRCCPLVFPPLHRLHTGLSADSTPFQERVDAPWALPTLAELAPPNPAHGGGGGAGWGRAKRCTLARLMAPALLLPTNSSLIPPPTLRHTLPHRLARLVFSGPPESPRLNLPLRPPPCYPLCATPPWDK